jgi:hypothetical protein
MHQISIITATIFKPGDANEPICSCGWRGPVRLNEHDAEILAAEHEQDFDRYRVLPEFARPDAFDEPICFDPWEHEAVVGREH